MRLGSDSLFDLADNVLDFAGVLFGHSVVFELSVLDNLAGLLLDRA